MTIFTIVSFYKSWFHRVRIAHYVRNVSKRVVVMVLEEIDKSVTITIAACFSLKSEMPFFKYKKLETETIYYSA